MKKLLLGSALLIPMIGHAAEPVKIGSVFSYTTGAVFADPYRKAVDLAMEEINADGGILGRPVKIIHADDQGKPEDAVRVTEELIKRDHVDFLTGAYYSHIGLAMSEVARREKKLFIANGSTTDKLLWEQGHPYVFRIWPSTYVQAVIITDKAAKMPAKKWATIASNYEWGKSVVGDFKTQLKAKKPDVEFVAQQWPTLKAINAQAEVQALLKAKPDAIFCSLLGADLSEFVREGRKRGLFKDRIVIGNYTGMPEFLDSLKDEAPEGWLVTGYPWDNLKDIPEHEIFLKHYQAKYPGERPAYTSLAGYASIYAFKAAAEKAGTVDSTKVADAMRGLTIPSIVGPLTFRAVDGQASQGVWMGKIVKENGHGKMTEIEYFPADTAQKSEAEIRKRQGK